MVALKSCCGCLSLRAGCYIVAIVQLTSPMVSSISGQQQHWLELLTFLSNWLSVILGVILVYGIVTEKSTWLRVWEIINTIFAVAMVSIGITYVALMTFSPKLMSSIGGEHVPRITIICDGAYVLFAGILGFLFSFVVFSYVKELKNKTVLPIDQK